MVVVNTFEKDFEYEGGYLRVHAKTPWDAKDYTDPIRELCLNDGQRSVYFTASLEEIRNLGKWLTQVANFEESVLGCHESRDVRLSVER